MMQLSGSQTQLHIGEKNGEFKKILILDLTLEICIELVRVEK